MSGWILAAAILVFMYGMGSRLVRRKDRQWDLDRLDEDIKLSKFWGFNAENDEKARADKIAEHKNWRSNIKFELGNWIAFMIGAALLVLSQAVWVGEDPSRSWDQLWNKINDNAWLVILSGVAVIFVYRFKNRMDLAESEIRWLNHTLKAVKDHAEDMRKGSIKDILKVQDRLDRLEGKSASG
jgi:hypothetical protein